MPAEPDVIFNAAPQTQTWLRAVLAAYSVRAASVEARKKELRMPVSA
ncbi:MULTISPECIES: hypothetical protein [unclassified Streptomyces]